VAAVLVTAGVETWFVLAVRSGQSPATAADPFEPEAARMRDRLSALACTSSVGPGATNMVTGAALATVNRLPVLLLPSDVFATRVADPVLQQLEHPSQRDVSANDAFRPVSRFFDRVHRPEQLPDALLGGMRVLTDPVQTGAVTICLPEDVQAQAHDWPDELFARRVWHVTVPQTRLILSLMLMLQIVATMQVFLEPLILTGGQSGTTTVVYLIYNYAFAFNNYGSAAALGIMLLVVLMGFAGAYLWLSRRGEEG